MYVSIGGVVFLKQMLKDGEINPYLGDKCLQEDDGELSDNASQSTTKTINDPKDHDISDNLVDRPSD